MTEIHYTTHILYFQSNLTNVSFISVDTNVLVWWFVSAWLDSKEVQSVKIAKLHICQDIKVHQKIERKFIGFVLGWLFDWLFSWLFGWWFVVTLPWLHKSSNISLGLGRTSSWSKWLYVPWNFIWLPHPMKKGSRGVIRVWKMD